MHLHKPTLSSKNSSHQAHCADTLTMRAQPAANTVYSFSAAMPVNTQLLECVCVCGCLLWLGVAAEVDAQRASLSLFGDTHKRTLRQRHLSCHLLLWSNWAMAAESLTQTQITCACCLTRRLLSTAVTKGQRSCWTRTHGIYPRMSGHQSLYTYDE